jgi:ribosomal protein S18 acetylase RimI-like enzyme
MKPCSMRRTPANAQIYTTAFEAAKQEYPDAFGAGGKDMQGLFMDREVTTLAIPTCVGSIVGAVSVYVHLPCGGWGGAGEVQGPPEIGYLFRRRQVGGRAVGKLLLAEALDHLAQREVDEVHLDVVEANTNALQLYESLGFTTYRIKEDEAGTVLGLVLDGLVSIKQAHAKLENHYLL